MWRFTPVDRSAGGAGVTAKIVERARRTGRWGRHPPLLVFPEGTCTHGGALLKFKSGSFAAAVPVLPVVLRYRAGPLCTGWVWRARAQPPFPRPFRGWPADLVHLARLLAQPGKVVEVTVLPPYAPSTAEAADAPLFAAGVRRAMAAALGVPQEEAASADDARAFYSRMISGYDKSA